MRMLLAVTLAAGCGGGASETKPAPEPKLPPAEAAPAASPVDPDVGLPEDPPADADGLPPVTVKLADLEPYRLSGDLEGLTPAKQVSFAAKLCLDKTGAPSALKLLRSTGDAAFDRSVLVRLTEWRFKPFAVETVPVGVCTVLFVVLRPS